MTILPPPLVELAAWVGQDIPSGDPRAGAVLSAASNLVQGYAGQDWSTTEAPADVVDIVVQVAARVWRNPSGAVSWTKGPFAERYSDGAANGLYLTEVEKSTLDRHRDGVSGISALGVTRGDAAYTDSYVPTAPEPSGQPFPWYHSGGY